MNISPTPTDDEVAAIVAAVEIGFTRAIEVVDDGGVNESSWRFSGRWWARPVARRRSRP